MDVRIAEFTSDAGSNWKNVEFYLPLTKHSIDRPVNAITIHLNGKDTVYWAGHYGPKFGRITVTVCLFENELELQPLGAKFEDITGGYKLQVNKVNDGDE